MQDKQPLNSAKYSVGLRLLIGFWLTIALAIFCVWLIARWSSAELDIAKVQTADIERLSRVEKRLQRDFRRGVPIQRLVQSTGRARRYSVVLYQLESEQLIAPRIPFLKRLEQDVQRLSGQLNPLRLKRAPYSLVGPSLVNFGDEQWLLFILEHNRERQNPLSLGLMLLIALFCLSLIYSLIFSKQLLTPISALRNTALELANGQWQARVDSRLFRRDELGELASTFNVMAQKIDSNWQSQRRLLADVSHELRSPLARLNMAVALAESHANNEIAKDSLLRIEQEAAKMDKLIGDVLTLSRMEAGMAQKTALSLHEVLDEVLDNASFEASQNQLIFSVSDILELTINGQKDALQSAIENVIRNAIRYTQTKVQVSIELNEGNCLITVDDDGPGLPESDIRNIFTPFYRSDHARNSQTGGIGLGLAITHAAVSNHGGQISATSLPTGGLSVVISLPVLVK